MALFILLPALSSEMANAQHLFKGKVIDSATRQPIQYATVNAENKTVITNENGDFRLSLKSDTSTIRISCIGCKSTMARFKQSEGKTIIAVAKAPIDLNEVTISPQLSANSFHTLSSVDLNLRPVNSSQDLMRLVPGLFIAQHMGGGKAEQIFMRGFDADHGTDVNVSVDGMPVNMVSHIHGQGYADLHFLIPETVADFDYGKGPYYIGYGDLTTAGYLSYSTKDALSKSVISLEGGQFNTFRVMGMIDLLSAEVKQNGENAYVAGEYNYTDGPFQLAEHYKRFNLFGKYSNQLDANNKLSLRASTFSTSWRPSGEIPERAVAAGTTALDDNGDPYIIPEAASPISRFGTIDSAQNGKSTRSNVIAKLATDLKTAGPWKTSCIIRITVSCYTSTLLFLRIIQLTATKENSRKSATCSATMES